MELIDAYKDIDSFSFEQKMIMTISIPLYVFRDDYVHPEDLIFELGCEFLVMLETAVNEVANV